MIVFGKQKQQKPKRSIGFRANNNTNQLQLFGGVSTRVPNATAFGSHAKRCTTGNTGQLCLEDGAHQTSVGAKSASEIARNDESEKRKEACVYDMRSIYRFGSSRWFVVGNQHCFEYWIFFRSLARGSNVQTFVKNRNLLM